MTYIQPINYCSVSYPCGQLSAYGYQVQMGDLKVIGKTKCVDSYADNCQFDFRVDIAQQLLGYVISSHHKTVTAGIS